MNVQDKNQSCKELIKDIVCSIFTHLDDKQTDSVPLVDFLSASTILCDEDKSAKLSFVFELFDSQRNGSLSRLEMHKFLRSLLCGIMVLNSNKQGSLTSMLYDTAVGSLVESMFTSTNEQISFDSFAKWYSKGGSSVALWIELLDLKKWPPSPKEQAIFSIHLPVLSQFSRYVLEVSSSDADRARSVIEKSSTYVLFFLILFLISKFVFVRNFVPNEFKIQIIFHNICVLSECCSSDGDITIDMFKIIVRKLVPNGLVMSTAAQKTISSTLLRIFEHFVIADIITPDSKVKLEDLTVALILLCTDSKSEKLAIAFDVFATSMNKHKTSYTATDEESCLDENTLFRFFRAILVMLFCLKGEPNQKSSFTGIDEVSRACALLVFDELGENEDSTTENRKVSFSDFASWYNVRGYLQLSWLELLDIRKWPIVDESSQMAREKLSQQTSLYQNCKSVNNETHSDLDKDKVVFQVALNTQSETKNMRFSFNDIHRFSVLLSAVSRRSLPSELLKIFDPHNINDTSISAVFITLSNIFSAYSNSSSDVIPNMSHSISSNTSSLGSVIPVELAIGFSLFAEGSKSSKLASAFEFLVAEASRGLSKLKLHLLLKSYLTMMMSLSNDFSNISKTNFVSLVESVAKNGTQIAFEYHLLDENNLISFAQFGNWYNEGGYLSLNWLELLDLTKWPNLFSMDNSNEIETSSHNVYNQDIHQFHNDDTILSFILNENADHLEFSSGNIVRFCDICGLNDMSPNMMLLNIEVDSDSCVTRSVFMRHIENVFIPINISKENSNIVLRFFANIFDTLDNLGEYDGFVPYNELLIGLCVLTGGNKSAKLAFAFDVLDHNDSGSLEMFVFCKFIKSFLLLLFAVSKTCITTSMDDNVIYTTTWEIVMTIFSESRRRNSHCITFEEFGSWYSDGGYLKLRWLELLDLKKWNVVMDSVLKDRKSIVDYHREFQAPSGSTFSAQTTDNLTTMDNKDRTAMDNKDRTAMDNKDRTTMGNEVTLAFTLTEDGDILEFTEYDISNLKKIKDSSQLHYYTATDITDVVYAEVGDENLLDKSAFKRCMRSLINVNVLSPKEKRFLTHALSLVYNTFAAIHWDEIKSIEFSIGLIMLAGGKKSGKLLHAFDLLDHDGDGHLTQSEMYIYFRSFLTMLCALNEECSSLICTDLARIVDSAAGRATRLVFATGDTNYDNLISFEEFGAWYTNGGFRVLSWLELLNLEKWEQSEIITQWEESNPKPRMSSVYKLGVNNSNESLQLCLINGNYASIEILETHAEAMRATAKYIKFSEIFLVDIASIVMRFSKYDSNTDKYWLLHTDFEECIYTLVPSNMLNGRDHAYLSQTLSNLFCSYDECRTGAVLAEEIACGLILLGQNSSVEGVMTCWTTLGDFFGTHTEMSYSQFSRFIRCAFCLLVSFTHTNEGFFSQEECAVIDDAVHLRAMKIFKALNIDPRHGFITFEEFMEWFVETGNMLSPWIAIRVALDSIDSCI
eukprot:GSMAST32.ASY1.ANO1.2413.1 assembled CDS